MSDLTDGASVPLNNSTKWSLVDAYITGKIIKKLLFFLLIYFLGYFGFSTILPFLIAIFYVLDHYNTQEKQERLQAARIISLGHEKDIILKAIPHLPNWIKFSEIEKVEWLNRMCKQMWQQVNDYSQDLLPKILEPAIQGYVSDFRFNHIKLGNEPLRIDGIKVYDPEDKRKIVMDLDVSYAGDCYVTFQTFKFEGGIKDIQLHGRLRVVFTPLVRRMPLIGGLQAYFMNPPHVDFDLIKVTQILDIPGIRSKIKNTTMKVINSMFLYPNAYSINLSKGVNVTRFAMFRTEGILRVHVVEAKNLENKDLIGKSDPYVVLKVGSIKVETPVIQNSLNPKWDFWCEFEIEPNSELKIEVWDRDEGSKDDHLGHARVDIAQVTKVKQAEMPIHLQGVDKGTIFLRLTWLSLSSDYTDLEAAIKETQLLSPYLHTALLMIYLESSLNLPMLTKTPPSTFVEVEVEKQIKQTDIEPENCEPVWEKGFTFLLHDPKRAVLHFRVQNENSRNLIGEVSFKVDNLKNEPRMELNRHTFFFSKPSSEASICCSMKLRILKNEYVKERDEDEHKMNNKPKKKVSKQGSNVSNRSKLSTHSMTVSENGSVLTQQESDQSLFLEDENVSNVGQIKLSISYSPQRQRLIVEIHEVNIIAKRRHSLDLYVKLNLQTDNGAKNNKFKTKIFKNSAHPVYNEKFEYLISGQDVDFSFLTLIVKNEKGLFDFGRNFIGQTIINLTKCDNLVEPFTDWFNLESKTDAHVYHLVK